MILTVDIGNTTVCVCGVEKREAEGHTAVFCTKLETVPGKDGAGLRSGASGRTEKSGCGDRAD